MSLFDIKLWLSRGVLADVLIRPERFSKVDEQIASRLDGFEFDYSRLRQLRDDKRNDLLRLKRLMESPAAAANKPKSQSMADLRKYEQSLRRQLYDLQSMIELLKKVVETEYEEIVYDIREPLIVFEKYLVGSSEIKGLKLLLASVRMRSDAADAVGSTIKGMEDAYAVFVEQTLHYIENDMRYYCGLGLRFDRLSSASGPKGTLSSHLQARSRLRLQLHGKQQYIISQIRKLETILSGLVRDRLLNQDIASALIEHMGYFAAQFGGFLDFTMRRVEIANHIIVEAVLLQKEKYLELQDIEQELHGFYDQFIGEHKEKNKDDASQWRTEQRNKRIREFEGYRSAVAGDLEKFRKGFDRSILKVEKQDLSDLRIEQIEIGKVRDELMLSKRDFLKWAGRALIVVGAGGVGLKAYDYLSQAPIAGSRRDILRSIVQMPGGAKTKAAVTADSAQPAVEPASVGTRQDAQPLPPQEPKPAGHTEPVHANPRGKVYLTIDDGPTSDTPKFIKYLSENGYKAIFFCVGSELEEYPRYALAIIKAGFVIGNHSYSHHKFSNISLDQARIEIDTTDNLIERLYKKAGRNRPFKVFRFPFGNRGGKNQDVIQGMLKERGYLGLDDLGYHGFLAKKDWRWTKDTEDRRKPAADRVLSASIGTLKPMDIILIHDTEYTAKMLLRPICEYIDKNGFETA